MLTESQSAYLETLQNVPVRFRPYDPLAAKAAQQIIQAINRARPELRTLLVGSMGLGIKGRGTLDIMVLGTIADLPIHISFLRPALGTPAVREDAEVIWRLTRSGYPMEVRLVDRDSQEVKDSLTVIDLLKKDADIRRQYEELKTKYEEASLRDYQEAKFLFFNQLLGN